MSAPCLDRHEGTLSFGCSPGVIRCNACGRRVMEKEAAASFGRVISDLERDYPFLKTVTN